MNTRCAYPWQQMIIDLTGEVVPCCYWSGYGNTGSPLGNTNQQSIPDIWNGAGYRDLRQRMASGDLDGHPCRDCMAYRAANSSFPRFSWPVSFAPETGHSYLGRLSDSFIALVKERADPVLLYEDDAALPFPDALHDDIRKHGAGRYSVWNGSVYFSSTDNSEPSHNGRSYELRCGDITIKLGGLVKDSRSGQNLLNAFGEYQRGASCMTARPSMISFISTADCNIDCPACSQNHVRLVNVQHRPETIPDVLAQVPDLFQFIWHGGEPYLIRAFRDFVDNYQTDDNPNLTFGFTSNGTMITAQEAKKLAKFPGINASVSIDSFSRETFRRVRAGADLDRVLANYLRLQATGDWPSRVFSVGMIVCKSNFGELNSNLRAAIDRDIGLNLSPVLLYPVTEQLNVFEDFAAETADWSEALVRAAETVEEAKAGRRTAIGRVDPSGMVDELRRIFEAEREVHAAIRPLEVRVTADYDPLDVMREPGIVAYLDDDLKPVAYVRLQRGVTDYVVRIPEVKLAGKRSLRLWLLHNLMEPNGIIANETRSLEQSQQLELVARRFSPIPRKRNIQMANYGIPSPLGLFVKEPNDIWKAHYQMIEMEQRAGFGVRPEGRRAGHWHRRASTLARFITGRK